jgi:hypothetical protein
MSDRYQHRDHRDNRRDRDHHRAGGGSGSGSGRDRYHNNDRYNNNDRDGWRYNNNDQNHSGGYGGDSRRSGSGRDYYDNRDRGGRRDHYDDRRDRDNRDRGSGNRGGDSYHSSAPSIFQVDRSGGPPPAPAVAAPAAVEKLVLNEEVAIEMRKKVVEVAKRLTERVLGVKFEDSQPDWTLGDALLQLKLQADGLAPSAAIPAMGGAGGKFTFKIDVPVDDPEMNYLGLLLGPKGETQKRMQAESGAKILIRGKGSSKDGNDEAPDEPLHVLISAESEESLNKAKDMVEELFFNPEYRANVKNAQLNRLAGKGSRSGLVLTDSLYAADAKDAFFPRPIGGIKEEVRVPRKAAGHIIGKGGETIRMLQEKTGAFVQVAKEDMYPEDDFKIVHVEGEEENVRDAKVEIQKLLDEFFDKVSLVLFFHFLTHF